MRRLTEFISETFIWGSGITHPKPGKERQAALFITATLAGTLLVIACAFFLLLARM